MQTWCGFNFGVFIIYQCNFIYLLGSTKVKMTGQAQADPASGLGMEWLENRRAALERFLCRTAQHPILCVDPDFINFLQSDEVSHNM